MTHAHWILATLIMIVNVNVLLSNDNTPLYRFVLGGALLGICAGRAIAS